MVAFCSVVITIALVAVAVAVDAMVVAPSAAAVEMVAANPTGEAWTALAESTIESAAAEVVTLRRLSSCCQFFQRARHPHARGVLAAPQAQYVSQVTR